MPRDDRPLILAVTGPTAAGKTDLAIALTRHFPIELINMDSAQIYRGMDIGTAKISPEEQRQYPHHLMSFLSPEQRYSAAEFVDDVSALAPAIHARGHIPLVVGGTPLYYKALTEGLAALPAADEALRQSLRTLVAKHGHAALRQELARIDPDMAEQVQGNNTQRLIRLVEIARLTGRAPSAIFRQQQQSAPASPFRFFHLCFFPEDRAALHARIALRFEQMLDKGLIDEVKRLRQTHQLSPDLPSMRCAGYRQVWAYLQGDYDDLPATKNNKARNTPYEELRDRGIFATRQLAKRQLTWLRKLPADNYISDAESIDMPTVLEAVSRAIDT